MDAAVGSMSRSSEGRRIATCQDVNREEMPWTGVMKSPFSPVRMENEGLDVV